MTTTSRLSTTRPTGRRATRALPALLGCALLGALGCSTVATPPPRAEAYETYRVGAPDQLEITILPEPALQRAVTVRPDGMISVDLVGDVPAGGRTVEEIATDIEQRISRFKRGASVNVSVVSATSTAVTVLGEVNAPGSFPLVKETRVAEAIGQVGGTRPTFASVDDIRVIRSGGGETVVYEVDLGAIQRGDLRTNIVLAKGDIVYVPPTLLARVGYSVQALLFPFQPLLGVAYSFGGAALAP